MKKLFLLATTALMLTGVAFADGGKKNKKKCAKAKTCTMAEKKSCTTGTSGKKSCCKDKTATVATM